MNVNEFLSHLEGVKKSGGGWVAKCPAHADKNPSLSVSSEGGKILVHCHSGCTADAVVGAMGLKMTDLMPPKVEVAKPAQPSKRMVARYDYQTAEGEVAYSVMRYEPKTFRQCHYDEHGDPVWKMDGVERVPYHLPEVISEAMVGGVIFAAEGEKDVETLRKWGFVATCNAGGAGKWEDAWSSYFLGAKKVVVIADNDPEEKNLPGQKHAWAVGQSLMSAGVEVKLMVMPDAKDVTEWAYKAPNRGRDEFLTAVTESAPWPSKWCFSAIEAESVGLGFDIMSLNDFPPYVPEEENPDILVRGRWLERGGSGWIISTAGTGKSIHSVQLAMSWSVGKPFGGLVPLRPLKFWILQSEDSPSRITIDREDIIAELTETSPEVEWRKVANGVMFVKFPGKVGSDLLHAIDDALGSVKPEMKPDIIIFNPFLAMIGGPVTEGSYVTPFFRGGEINRQPTYGLQYILERHKVAALFYHHTPKPPTEKELDGWMKSAFPEYQGAGSGDITNWGRSFITMMKVKNHPDYVCLTAGKNGSEIDWDVIGCAYRHYLAHSSGVGITGRRRHAWRELTAEELEEVSGEGTGKEEIRDKTEKLAEELRVTPMYVRQIQNKIGTGKAAREMLFNLKTRPEDYDLVCEKHLVGKAYYQFIGAAGKIRQAVIMANQEEEIERRKRGDN